MSHNLDDSAAAHAIHALSSGEEVIVDAALQFDDGLRAQYDTHRRVAEELLEGFTDDVPSPSPDLWGRIASESGIEDSPRGRSKGPTSTARPLKRIFLFGLAAMLASFTVAGLIVATRPDAPDIQDLAAHAAGSQGAATVSLDGTAIGNGVSVQAVITRDGSSFLDGRTLPTLSNAKTYQLWAIVGDSVISVGVLGNRPGISPFRVDGALSGLALTEEALGGVVASTEDPVAIWLATG